MKPEKKPAAKSAVVKSAVTTRSIERDVQRRQQAAHRIIDRMDVQRPHIPRLAAEALACDEAPAPAPTLREDLQQQRRREIGAPMATLNQIPDPLAGIGWDSAMELWARIQTPLMFAVWSIGCFLLGRLV